MKTWTGGLPDAEAERLSALMMEAFDERERGWTADEIASLSAAPGVTVLSVEDGFIAVRAAGDEAEILTLAVGPDAQGRGIARRLLSAALNHLAGMRVLLEVAEGNAAALSLYCGAGFTEAGRRKGYMKRSDGTREDALILERHCP